MNTPNPAFPDLPADLSFSEAAARVLDLQTSWSSGNTPEMQERGVLIRQAGPRAVKAMLVGLSSLVPDLAVEGRDGTGRKTRVPWIRVYSKSRSPSATSGWYVSFLFAADGNAVFLSINQGTTSWESGSFRASAAEVLDARVEWARGILDARIDETGASVDAIDLKDPRGLGVLYERGNVCSYRLTHDQVSDEAVRDRVRRLVGLLQALYAAEDDPARRMAELRGPSSFEPSPPSSPLSDVPAFIQAVREEYGPTLVESRRAAEEEARQLLNQLAGGMTREQAQALGQFFNRGEWAGVMRHNRFLPAFAGATMDRLVEPIETFNEWTRRLWRSPEEEALQAVDEVLREPNAFPGAGRSYPTMLMYLRDPRRFAVWLQVCHQGLIAISDYDEPKGRTGGVDRYLRYCTAVRQFAERWSLEPQEIDAVLVAAARAAAEAKDVAARRTEVAATGVAEAQAKHEAKEEASQPRRPKIFLCYRREDTQWVARSIYESLADRYGHEQVFRDINSTPAGVRFSTWIELRVGQCDVMIVLIGDAWSSAKDHTGQRRLELPKDWVRHEIETALRRGIPMIPVRVQGARMPSEDELPPSIADFTGFQSAEVTDSRWAYDIGLLIEAIDDLVRSGESNK